MARNFVKLEDAAQQLGISRDRLNVLREEGKIRGYRDGASWKFGSDDLEKLASDLASGGDDDALDIDLLDEPPSPGDSILLSERELGEGEKSTSSTIIGQTMPPPSEGSDVKLAEPMESDLKITGDSDLSLASDVRGGVSGSDVLGLGSGGGESDTKGSGLGMQFEDIEELELDLEAESSKIFLGGEAKSAGPPAKGGSSDLELAGSGLSLGGSDLQLEGGSDPSVTAEKPKGAQAPGESTVELAADEDDELVLGEGTGSDITLGAGDSGINLVPSDSGLSLAEEPLDLTGSSVESLELGEDAEISLEAIGDSEGATQLKADDDFMLTPLEDAGGDDDSGSQVIALDSESFDESANTMLGVGLADELESADTDSPQLTPVSMTAAMPEAPYSVWNVMGLMLCLLLLMLTGMMFFDLIRNMWSWSEATAQNSTIMDGLLEAIPIFK